MQIKCLTDLKGLEHQYWLQGNSEISEILKACIDMFEDCIEDAREEGYDQGCDEERDNAYREGYDDAKQELEYELEEIRDKLNKILGDI